MNLIVSLVTAEPIRQFLSGEVQRIVDSDMQVRLGVVQTRPLLQIRPTAQGLVWGSQI